MSHPYKGATSLPLHPQAFPVLPDPVHEDLAKLHNPRKAYKWYYSSQSAAADMDLPLPQLQTFLRAYFHLKSADWHGNKTHPLKAWEATELAKMPGYYVMPLVASMPETCATDMNEHEWNVVEQKGKEWLSDADLRFYCEEYSRVGFQGSLNWYRSFTNERNKAELELWSRKLLNVPLLFLGGEKDWGVWQDPGAVQTMRYV